MCYGNPSKSLAIARSRMTPEAWARFEREFDDFCVVNGMPRNPGWSQFNWAKWAYLSAWPTDDEIQALVAHVNTDRRVTDAYHEKIAIASMTDEQAQMSLERLCRMGETE